ncbi:MAG TPA: hypothetical protein VLY86_02990 [Methanothrix sp.]|nr:hypothetical protein [Methanothrix sp.]
MKNEKGFAFVLFSVFLVVALGVAIAENQTANATMNKTTNVTMNKITNVTMNKTTNVTMNKATNVTMNKTTNATLKNPFKSAKGVPPDESGR